MVTKTIVCEVMEQHGMEKGSLQKNMKFLQFRHFEFAMNDAMMPKKKY